MPDATHRVLRIFLASPGDLQDERHAGKVVVDGINAGPARRLGWHIELLGWEETLPGYARPQALINADVDACDLFVGALWERWGSPTGKYTSGFEEEFERARALRETTGRTPEIWLFFKTMDPKLVRDPGEDAKKVLAFRQRQIDEKKLLFREFTTTDEWERLLWQHLTTELTERAIAGFAVPEAPVADADTGVVGAEHTPSEAPTAEAVQAHSEALTAVGNTAASIAEALRRSETSLVAKDVPSLVRMNLMTAAALSHSRTSDTYGAHDSNLAFRYRRQFELIDADLAEVTFVFRTLLTLAENVAGWYWLRDRDATSLLRFITVRAATDSEETVRIGALRLLTLRSALATGTDGRNFFTRKFFEAVLSDADPRVRRAGLQLLDEVAANIDDATDILEALAGADSELSAEARAVLARIRVANDPSAALALFTQERAPIPEQALAELQAQRAAIPTPRLEEALGAEQPEIRALASAELGARGELGAERARQLLADGAAVVREAVVVAGFPGFTEADLDLALTDFPKETRLFQPDRTDNMRLAYFSRLDADALLGRVDWFDPLDARAAYEVLATDHFQVIATRLRADLKDRFEGLKGRSLAAVTTRTNPHAAQILADQFQELDDYVRDGFIVAALRGLRVNGTRRDAALVRPYVASNGFRVRKTALDALARFAHPDDAELLQEAALNETELRLTAGAAALRAATRSDLPHVRERFLNSGKPELVRMALELRVTSAERREMISLAEGLTYNDDQPTRKEAVRYLVERLRPQPLETFLDTYLSSARYFYNVVTWLDRVLYAPGEIREAFRRDLSV